MRFHQRPFSLRELKLEVTHRCPLACIHCSSDAAPDVTRVMSDADCVRIIGEAAALGVTRIAFSGGEPLVWAGIEDAVSRAVTAGLDVTVYTSGTPDGAAARMAGLKRAGARRVVFSVFADSPEIHEAVTRIRGSFARTLEAAAAALKVGLAAEFHFVPLASTYKTLERIVQLAMEVGISRVSVLRFVPQGRGAVLNSNALDKRQSLELKAKIESLRKKGSTSGLAPRTTTSSLTTNRNAARGSTGLSLIRTSSSTPAMPSNEFRLRNSLGRRTFRGWTDSRSKSAGSTHHISRRFEGT